MTSCQVCQVLEAVLAFNRLCHQQYCRRLWETFYICRHAFIKDLKMNCMHSKKSYSPCRFRVCLAASQFAHVSMLLSVSPAINYDRNGLWTKRTMAEPECGRNVLWPNRSVDETSRKHLIQGLSLCFPNNYYITNHVGFGFFYFRHSA